MRKKACKSGSRPRPSAWSPPRCSTTTASFACRRHCPKPAMIRSIPAYMPKSPVTTAHRYGNPRPWTTRIFHCRAISPPAGATSSVSTMLAANSTHSPWASPSTSAKPYMKAIPSPSRKTWRPTMSKSPVFVTACGAGSAVSPYCCSPCRAWCCTGAWRRCVRWRKIWRR